MTALPLSGRGDGHCQDDGDGDDHHSADAQCTELSQAQQGFLVRHFHRRTGSNGEGGGCRCRSRGTWGQLLRHLFSVPERALGEKLSQVELRDQDWSVENNGTESDEM